MNETPNHSATDDAAFDARLRAVMHAVQAPADLQARLLRIPDLAAEQSGEVNTTTAQLPAANDPGFLRRLLPAAAALLLAIGIGLYYQPDLNAALAGEIFGHIYKEEPNFGDGTALSLSEVNARIAPFTGEALQPEASEALEVSFAKDCYIARQRTMHLVVKGKTGPVNVMMIPGQVVDSEVRIADQRFNGLVTPASGGTLVVVGNKQEPISATRDQVASSLHWEY